MFLSQKNITIFLLKISSSAYNIHPAIHGLTSIKLDNHNHMIARFAQKNKQKEKKKGKKCKKEQKYTAFGLPSWSPTLVLTELDLA